MKIAIGAFIAIGIGVAIAFWVAPPFGSFSILAKSSK